MQPPTQTAQFHDEFRAWWAQAAERFRPRARRFAGGDAQIGEDALQETAAYLWGRWQDYRPAPAGVVVNQVLRHRAVNLLRARGPRSFPGQAPEARLSNEPEPSREVTIREALEVHQGCVGGLPDSAEEPTRTIHELRAVGLSSLEIARRLQIPYQRVRRLGMLAAIKVGTCLVRHCSAGDATEAASHQEVLALLVHYQQNQPSLQDLPPEALRQIYDLHWQGLSMGTIGSQVGLPTDRARGLLEDAVNCVLRFLISCP